MKRYILSLSTSVLLSAALTACGPGSQPPENAVPESTARAAALARAPGGNVRSHELEREDGRWIYSYDIEVPGSEGIEEVQVDAVSGEVVGQEHESATAERREAREEAEADERSGASMSEPGEGPEMEEQEEAENPAPAVDPYRPDVEADEFVDRVDNPFFPLVHGTVYRYENTDDRSRNVVTVTGETRTVMGIEATVVLDREYAGDRLVEETRDWYAQDRDGNVWYLGEDSREMEDGRVASTEGSWEAGLDGALPGIIMLAHPAPGARYRQEYLPGAAEDVGEVLERGVAVTVPFGSFRDCLRTADTTPLEPDVRETKVYCRGVGLVQEKESASSRNQLVAIDTPAAAAAGRR